MGCFGEGPGAGCVGNGMIQCFVTLLGYKSVSYFCCGSYGTNSCRFVSFIYASVYHWCSASASMVLPSEKVYPVGVRVFFYWPNPGYRTRPTEAIQQSVPNLDLSHCCPGRCGGRRVSSARRLPTPSPATKMTRSPRSKRSGMIQSYSGVGSLRRASPPNQPALRFRFSRKNEPIQNALNPRHLLV